MSNPVVTSARKVCEISQHVKLNQQGINRAAQQILDQLLKEPYTPSSWSLVPLHPIPSNHSPTFISNWIFLVSTLNFSFWSDYTSPNERYGVKWKTGCDGKGKVVDRREEQETVVWTGYFSLLAALHRAIEDGVDVTNPRWYANATEGELRKVFRSDQKEGIPLIEERIRVMREVGKVLCEKFDGSFEPLLRSANHSALTLVDLVVSLFPCYNDVTTYSPLPNDSIYIRKRAQILVAELWAAFEGRGLGRFDDIDRLSMFADYRVPQVLHSLGTIEYDRHLTTILVEGKMLKNGDKEEVEIRCASIVVVEEIKQEIERLVKRGGFEDRIQVPNSVLLDFLLWDLAKVEEAKGRAVLPHHKTRSVFY